MNPNEVIRWKSEVLDEVLDEAAAPRGLWCGQCESFGTCRGD